MSLRLETTLAGYGRAAVDLKTRMWEVSQTSIARDYMRVLAEDVFAHFRREDAYAPAEGDTRMLNALVGMTSLAWRVGEPYVLAPAMTAVIAAAADALDLTGERLPGDIAPTEHGVLFLPQPVYHRLPSGAVNGIGAITWARLTTTGGRPAWAVFGWSDRDDPHSPAAADIRARLAGHTQLSSQLGPYLLTDFDLVPIGEPLDAAPDRPTVETAAADERDRDWQPAADGLYCIDHSTTAPHTPVLTALAYAFWRIQAQPLAATARPPLDRAATRRAARASIVHGTRIVMLRRLHATDLDAGTGGTPAGTTPSGSSSAGTGGTSATATETPTASGSTPTSKAPTAHRCSAARRSRSSPVDSRTQRPGVQSRACRPPGQLAIIQLEKRIHDHARTPTESRPPRGASSAARCVGRTTL